MGWLICSVWTDLEKREIGCVRLGADVYEEMDDVSCVVRARNVGSERGDG